MVIIIGVLILWLIVVGNGLMDFNCVNEFIYGDVNDNCEFGVEDGLFI